MVMKFYESSPWGDMTTILPMQQSFQSITLFKLVHTVKKVNPAMFVDGIIVCKPSCLH